MGWDVLRAALDLLMAQGDKSPVVSFHGGEPLLEFSTIRRTVEYLMACKPDGTRPRFFVTTNGTLLDDEVDCFLERHRVGTFLSFDGVRAAQELRAPGTFQHLDRTLAALRDRHPRFFATNVTIVMTVTSANLRYLNRSVQYFLTRGVQSIGLNPLITSDAGWRDTTRDELERQFLLLDETCRMHLEQTGTVPLTLFRHWGRPHRTPAPSITACCAMSGGKLAVDVDGTCYACVSLTESCQELPSGLLEGMVDAFRLGMITDPEVPRRLHNVPSEIQKNRVFCAREEMYSSYGSCRDCQFVDRCIICPTCSGYIPGNTDPRLVPDHQCAFNFLAMKYRDRFPPMNHPSKISARMDLSARARDGKETAPTQ
jgi:sulfatase maturation enzyme AslB (radical SAM superfamily)